MLRSLHNHWTLWLHNSDDESLNQLVSYSMGICNMLTCIIVKKAGSIQSSGPFKALYTLLP